MAGPLGRPVTPEPHLLKRAYLGSGETMLRETRATALFYFPKPILFLLIVLVLDYGDYSAMHSGAPSVPGLTSAFSSINSTLGSLAGDGMDFLLVLTLLGLLYLLVQYLRWISTVYGVTTQRVLVQSGIFSRNFDEIPLNQIRGVDVHQTVGQRILGYGTMWVSSEGGTRLGNEAWRGIPRPFEFQRLVENATQSAPPRPGGR